MTPIGYARQLRNGAMARVAIGVAAQIGSQLTICVGVLFFSAGSASAFSFDQAIDRCRQTVGWPIVKACMGGRRGKASDELGADLKACRGKASPRVRACVQRAMIAAYGWPRVEEAIEHCRQTVGRPIGGNADLEEYRARAAPLSAAETAAGPRISSTICAAFAGTYAASTLPSRATIASHPLAHPYRRSFATSLCRQMIRPKDNPRANTILKSGGCQSLS